MDQFMRSWQRGAVSVLWPVFAGFAILVLVGILTGCASAPPVDIIGAALRVEQARQWAVGCQGGGSCEMPPGLEYFAREIGIDLPDFLRPCRGLPDRDKCEKATLIGFALALINDLPAAPTPGEPRMRLAGIEPIPPAEPHTFERPVAEYIYISLLGTSHRDEYTEWLVYHNVVADVLRSYIPNATYRRIRAADQWFEINGRDVPGPLPREYLNAGLADVAKMVAVQLDSPSLRLGRGSDGAGGERCWAVTRRSLASVSIFIATRREWISSDELCKFWHHERSQ